MESSEDDELVTDNDSIYPSSVASTAAPSVASDSEHIVDHNKPVDVASALNSALLLVSDPVADELLSLVCHLFELTDKRHASRVMKQVLQQLSSGDATDATSAIRGLMFNEDTLQRVADYIEKHVRDVYAPVPANRRKMNELLGDNVGCISAEPPPFDKDQEQLRVTALDKLTNLLLPPSQDYLSQLLGKDASVAGINRLFGTFQLQHRNCRLLLNIVHALLAEYISKLGGSTND